MTPRSSRAWRHVTALCVVLHGAAALAQPTCTPTAGNLIVNATTCQLGGVNSFGSVQITNGGVVQVVQFDGANKIGTGNLELRAPSIFVDATSSITAVGRGYQTARCDSGAGPTATAGGPGGCKVSDSGGGGAHFGRGGRGTKDCNSGACGSDPGVCELPGEFEEACGSDLDGSGLFCTGTGNCWDCDALPNNAGLAYWHSIYAPEMGASGGDKGCYDGDGFFGQPNVGGPGGGRIVLVGVNGGAGSVNVQGQVIADGRRACGTGNDSGGGGAGGTVFIVGDTVTVGPAAVVTSAGGLGGDTQPDPTGVCSFAQQNGTCDDCGGGGGGGIVSVLSTTAAISDDAVFNVDGARGGVCAICAGEAGGGVGELQISGAFVDEVCDGYDNDFDGPVDEGFPALPCGSPACLGGQPQVCLPTPGCVGAVTDTRARFMVIVDSSGSMLGDLVGRTTFGDGSTDHPGLDTDGNGAADDSRLYRAKQALQTVIAAYPEIDFSLARYHQDQAVDRSCQLAHWFECHDICCTYDDPRNNTGAPPNPACTLDAAKVGAAAPVDVLKSSPGDECIHYAGSCGPPRRGADVLAGFGSDINQYLMWLDGRESNFVDDETSGDYCDFAGGGDCELRGTGPTPLAGSLLAAADYLRPIAGCDAAALGGCRDYAVILLTDGAESCQGDPAGAATVLLTLGIETYVVGFSVLPTEEAELNAIARAGSAGTRDAFLVGDEDALANTLADIVGASIVFEACNGLDDDCDGLTDEDYFGLGLPCCDPCAGTIVCNATQDGTECSGEEPCPELCNNVDDDCDAFTDEGLICFEVCNGIDDDSDGLTDELPLPNLGDPCGSDAGECAPGVTCCAGGRLECCGGEGPSAETCDCLDNNCNTVTDEGAGIPCYVGPPVHCPDPASGACVGICRPGLRACVTTGCPTPALGPCLGEVGPRPEECNCLDDDCDGFTDDGAICPGGAPCIDCACALPCDPGSEFPCPSGEMCDCACGAAPPCYCIADPCADLSCPAGQACDSCTGACIDACIGLSCGGTPCCAGVCCESWELCEEVSPGTVACVDASCTSEDFPCGPGEVCIDHACRPDPCADASCGPDEFCSGGECLPICPACPPDEACVDGACRPDPCAGVSCVGADVICCAGVCGADPCGSMRCPRGSFCDACARACVDDECAAIGCPTGTACSRNVCREIVEPPLTTFGASGAGGCACDAGGGPGPASAWLIGALLALLFRRRLPSRTLALALVLCIAGCRVRTIGLAPADGGARSDGRETDGPLLEPRPEDCNGLDDDLDGVVDNGDPGGGLPCGLSEGACAEGVTRCVAADVICAGDVRPEAESCDTLDNDCDGETDEVFDMCDVQSCGSCAGAGIAGDTGRCAIAHAIAYCDASGCAGAACDDCAVCRVDACEPGDIDCQLDAPPDDCDCTCRVPPRSEVCDGIDDDCDGTTDEDVTTPNFCRQVGTCSGATPVCQGAMGWCCGYAPGVETTPAANPCGFVVADEEALCDGADGDCDGVADDPFVGVCDNGLLGACRDGGVRICDPMDPMSTICDLSAPPDPIGGPSAEVCNGIDDDCNGIVDDPAGAGRIVDDMVHVAWSGNDFWIDRFEASRPDATGFELGQTTNRRCVRSGVLPWRGATYAAAEAACIAAGKRLCTSDEYLAACAGPSGQVYPYGDAFDPAACNAEPLDGVLGGADDDVLLPAGDTMLATCVSDDGVHDASGNLKEWTADITGQTADGIDIAVLRGGAYDTPTVGATCAFRASRAPVNTVLPTIGFRCCSSSPP